ncbi:class A beta-lactamase [Streptomyces sp. NPDC049954]|uniref:class A beta-lactamase n=1 Tax=Streptomyces sp. NPDC049954 TaxID=3155779 RepID=UPI003419F149
MRHHHTPDHTGPTSVRPGPGRRSVLVLGAGATAAALASAAPAAWGGERAAGADRTADLPARFAALERGHCARLGVHVHDTGSGRTLSHRADELFPMCSLFKTLAVGAVLRDLDHDGRCLERRIHYTQREVDAAGYAPVTGTPENLRAGLTVAQLCAAALIHSDNAAANLLLRALGGPAAVTRFCRSTGDRVTRLDRYEPELNSAEPGRVTDTTTPRALGTTYGRLLLGKVLDPEDRARLGAWMRANRTSDDKFRAGLPADWALADKTGSGDWGTSNDAGVAFPPGRAPILLTVLTTRHTADAEGDNALVAEVARLVVGALG